jgi:hypothetical protein
MAATPFKMGRISHPNKAGEEWELVDLDSVDWVPTRFVPRQLIIGGAGNITMISQSGLSSVTIPVQAGQILDLAVAKIVRATTTATYILAVE